MGNGALSDIIKIIENMGAGKAWAVVISFFLYIILQGITIAIIYLIWKGLYRANKTLFKRIEKQKGKTLYVVFLQKAVGFVITLFCVVMVFGWNNFRQSFFGSATVIAAIVGFAGQDVIKDTLAGLQISVYRPFDIGDRIETEDGSAGIVESITLRHVVLRKIDTVRIVIPNSKLNVMSIQNYSYLDVPRSMQLKFPISYDSDIDLAKQVIGDVVRRSPYCLPGMHNEEHERVFAPVYFLELADSALILATTVYYSHQTRSEIVRDSVNSGVFKALGENGIEIPYTHINVIVDKEQA